MNEIETANTDCAVSENNTRSKLIPNGAQFDTRQSEKFEASATIATLFSSKLCNGALNGSVEDDAEKTQKTDTSLEAVSQIQAAGDESKSTKKAKSKRKGKSEQADASADANPSLNHDFDITAIVRNKYQQSEARGSDEKIKIIVSQLERCEVKGDAGVPEAPQIPDPNIEYVAYQSELQMPLIMKIIQKDLSEPYSIYTYRYFIHNWPNLCFLAMSEALCVGAIVCKLDMHRKVIKRGYIAMLAVDKQYRKHGIGSTLVKRAIKEMISGEADEVVLETEITNRPALRLYEALGFVRDKRLFRYYLNGVDALRLKLWLR